MITLELLVVLSCECVRRCSSVCAEAYNPDEDEDEGSESRVIHHKSEAQRQRLQEACKDILLFKTLEQVNTSLQTLWTCGTPADMWRLSVCLSQDQFAEVLDSMFEVLVKPHECIINQGDDGDNFYVIERWDDPASSDVPQQRMLTASVSLQGCVWYPDPEGRRQPLRGLLW